MPPIMRRLIALLWIAIFIIQVLGPVDAHAQGLPAAPQLTSAIIPNFAAAASVSFSGLGDVLIGENFTFNLIFRNTGSTPGYGPFIDLVLPANGADGDYNRDTPDGVEFIQASMAGYTFNTLDDTLAVQKFPNAGSVTCVSHPWAKLSTGAYAQACGPAGDTLISLRLPFGGVVPNQPISAIVVDAKLSNLADLGTQLILRARGGFIYGNDSLDNWCCGDPPIIGYPATNSASWPASPLTPQLITFQKTYTGPDNVQDETTSGPNFIRQYTLTANLATGQTITNLDIFDKLPDNEQFVSLDAGATTPGYAIISTPSTTLPGGILDVRYGSVTGSSSTTDLQASFNFYVPRLNVSSAAVIDPVTGNVALSRNIGWLTGTWTPADARDAVQSVASDIQCVPGGNCQPLHTLQDKALAIQKTVTNLTDGNPSPGDVFEYSLVFQVSDYFAFNSVSVTDLISDGQHVLAGFTPTLQINGNGYTLATAALGAANYDIACNYTGGPGAECTLNNPAADDGTTSLIFRVSPEIITRGQNGRLIGGCVNPAGGLLATCSPASPGDGPTTGVITFRTVLQEAFTNNYPSGDPSVDQGDKFTDTALASGAILDNNTFASGQAQNDNATAGFAVQRNNLIKEIYAINGDTNPANWPTKNGSVSIKPNDTLTYRLIYNLNTSDVEDLAFDEYLPLPIFFVADPDANDNPAHTDGPNFVFDDTTSATAPAVGHAQFGPTDTFRAYSGIVPTLNQNPAQNILHFAYGDYDNPANQSTIIDLLFTLTVSSEPFADSAFMTNEAHEVEGSTNAGPFTQDAVKWVVQAQPALATSKGVIWTSGASAVLDPLPAGPVSFLGPGATPRWSGLINSSNLAANPIDSNITGVRAGDIVSFAIVIENRGSSLLGAFDLVIRDQMPDVYGIPASGLNLQIYYGSGAGPIGTVTDGVVTQADCSGGACGPDNLANTPDDLFGLGIKLADPVGRGVCAGYNPNLGNNVIVLTYDLQIKSNLRPGTFINTGRMTRYSSSSGGPNHVQGNITWNLNVRDTAETSWIRATGLPSTGFAPQRVTILPIQPDEAAYTAMPALWLEIPSIKVQAPIVGVPNTATGWNLSWLSDQVGYLQGTTLPTEVGNTVLTAHVYLADGSPGPFHQLAQLRWGQTVILHANGYRYLYEVRQVRTVSPNNLTVFKEDGYAWITLLTCKNYDPAQDIYRNRVAVRAILLKVEPE